MKRKNSSNSSWLIDSNISPCDAICPRSFAAIKTLKEIIFIFNSYKTLTQYLPSQ